MFKGVKESHVSIHTYPEYDKAHLDLFSCTILSEDIINRFFKEYFCDYKYQFIDRIFTEKPIFIITYFYCYHK